jgi:predicted NBD/HSP70 family sugar kinase
MSDHPQPLSQKHLRITNAWRVLERVRAAEATSRVRIAAETGLTVTTVHRLVADLRKRRLVVDGTMAGSGGVGRPATLFHFNAQVGHVVGIDVGNETTRAGLAHLDGQIVASDDCPTAQIASDLVGGLEAIIRGLQERAAVRRDSLVAICIGVPGVIDTAGDVIVRASLHQPWEGMPLGSELRRSLGVEVTVAQDDHLTALAELRRGACVGLRHALIVNIGKGIGAGLVIDGEPFYGARAAAGRLGWIPLPIVAAGPEGGVDGMPLALPASQLLTADGLIADYRRFGGMADVGGAIDVFAADRADDAAARRAIDLFAERLGTCIGMGVAIMDPQIVVVGGGISAAFDRLAPIVMSHLSAIVHLPPKVIASRIALDAGVVGAIEAAMERADAWLVELISA